MREPIMLEFQWVTVYSNAKVLKSLSFLRFLLVDITRIYEKKVYYLTICIIRVYTIQSVVPAKSPPNPLAPNDFPRGVYSVQFYFSKYLKLYYLGAVANYTIVFVLCRLFSMTS